MAQWSGFLRGVLESQKLLQSEVNLEMTWGHSGQELLRQPQWPEPTLACADPAGKQPQRPLALSLTLAFLLWEPWLGWPLEGLPAASHLE